MKFRKILKIAGCAVLSAMCVFGAAGCGKSGSSGEVDDLKYDEFGEPIFDNINLKVWSVLTDPDATYLQNVNKDFNAYYGGNGLTATISDISVSDFYSQLSNTINTYPEGAPDVVVIHSERLTNLAKDGVLVPMDEYLTAAKSGFNKNDYLENVISECYYKNKLYGVPLDIHAGVWYVRSDILEKNGLEKPTKLSEFIDVCNTLIEKYDAGELWHRAMNSTADGASLREWTTAKDLGDSYHPVVMSSTGGIENGWIPQSAVLQNGGKLVDSSGKPAWNTDGLVDALQMFRDWRTGTSTQEGRTYSGAFVDERDSAETVWSRLADGSAVFSCEGPWYCEQRINEYESVLGNLKDVNDKTYSPLEIMNMSCLYAMDEDSADAAKIYGVGHCFSITKTVTSKTKRVAAAIYAQYMTENSASYVTSGGHLPANKKVYDSPAYKNSAAFTKYLQAFGDPENFVTLGNTPYYSAVYERLKDCYKDVFTKSKDEQSVKTLVQTRYNEAIKQINSSQGF